MDELYVGREAFTFAKALDKGVRSKIDMNRIPKSMRDLLERYAFN
jgi:hypothetical protein